MDVSDMLADITSGHEIEAGMMLKKPSLSDLFGLLRSIFPACDKLACKFVISGLLLHQKLWPARLICIYPNNAYVMVTYIKVTPVISP